MSLAVVLKALLIIDQFGMRLYTNYMILWSSYNFWFWTSFDKPTFEQRGTKNYGVAAWLVLQLRLLKFLLKEMISSPITNSSLTKQRNLIGYVYSSLILTLHLILFTDCTEKLKNALSLICWWDLEVNDYNCALCWMKILRKQITLLVY